MMQLHIVLQIWLLISLTITTDIYCEDFYFETNELMHLHWTVRTVCREELNSESSTTKKQEKGKKVAGIRQCIGYVLIHVFLF